MVDIWLLCGPWADGRKVERGEGYETLAFLPWAGVATGQCSLGCVLRFPLMALSILLESWLQGRKNRAVSKDSSFTLASNDISWWFGGSVSDFLLMDLHKGHPYSKKKKNLSLKLLLRFIALVIFSW